MSDDTSFVLTPSVLYNLVQLEVAMQYSKAVLLTGETGCGKTTLIQALARAHGRSEDLVVISLDVSIDAKDLIGSYVSAEEPGLFVWRPGTLTTALLEGKWVLVEDMDIASEDVASVVSGIITNGFITVNDCPLPQPIVASSSFRIFGTVQTGVPTGAAGWANAGAVTRTARAIPGQHVWATVPAVPPDSVEMHAIVAHRVGGVALLTELLLLLHSLRRHGRTSATHIPVGCTASPTLPGPSGPASAFGKTKPEVADRDTAFPLACDGPGTAVDGCAVGGVFARDDLATLAAQRYAVAAAALCGTQPMDIPPPSPVTLSPRRRPAAAFATHGSAPSVVPPTPLHPRFAAAVRFGGELAIMSPAAASAGAWPDPTQSPTTAAGESPAVIAARAAARTALAAGGGEAAAAATAAAQSVGELDRAVLSALVARASLRDVLKWAARVAGGGLMEGSSVGIGAVTATGTRGHVASGVRERALVEAVDVFVCGLPHMAARMRLLNAFATCFGVSGDRAADLLASRPTVRVIPCGIAAPPVAQLQQPPTGDGKRRKRTRSDADGAAAAGAVVPVSRPIGSTGSALYEFQLGRTTFQTTALPSDAQSPYSIRLPVSGRGFAKTGHGLRLLERLAVAVMSGEPVLLTGETGVGKTFLCGALAELFGVPPATLVAHNLSSHSDVSELFGGIVPVDVAVAARGVVSECIDAFPTAFDEGGNVKMLDYIHKAMGRRQWGRAVTAVVRCCEEATRRLQAVVDAVAPAEHAAAAAAKAAAKAPAQAPQQAAKESQAPAAPLSKRAAKRAAAIGTAAAADGTSAAATATPNSGLVAAAMAAATEAAAAVAAGTAATAALPRWSVLLAKATTVQLQVDKGFAFEWTDGSLVRAWRGGQWLLLDEVNLAPGEVLDRIGSSVDGIATGAGLTLPEAGGERIPVSPTFRLFACMNPPTDVGKSDIPPALKARFTTIHVDDTKDPADIKIIVSAAIAAEPALRDISADKIVACYRDLCAAAADGRFSSGGLGGAAAGDADAGPQRITFSLRTLSRALSFAVRVARTHTAAFGLWEAFQMCFIAVLPSAVVSVAEDIMARHLQRPTVVPKPNPTPIQVVVSSYALPRGELDPVEDPHYVLTASVKRHIDSVARAVAARLPVLLQGPTAAGKTAAVQYLATRVGTRLVRINNHDATDVAEYFGSYVTAADGSLTFAEGPLVSAVRSGAWVLLDELNLAPTEVLESLNRLLDDNRELYVPPTGETIKPHPAFHLFATQNPAGLYGGRKQLSRAFRNRFVELNVGSIPYAELEEMLVGRFSLPSTISSRMVEVMKRLQSSRVASSVFAGRGGFVTPRDLFRWAARVQLNYPMAEAGMMLLGDRCRTPADRDVVRDVVAEVCKVDRGTLNSEVMYIRAGAALTPFEDRMEIVERAFAGDDVSAMDIPPMDPQREMTEVERKADFKQRLAASGEDVIDAVKRGVVNDLTGAKRKLARKLIAEKAHLFPPGSVRGPQDESPEALEAASAACVRYSPFEKAPSAPLSDSVAALVSSALRGLRGVVWSPAMLRAFALVGSCFLHRDPCLLVGDPGVGKTMVCQLWAAALGRPLVAVNLHMHTEPADLIGCMGPSPLAASGGPLFAWRDGPVTGAMRDGAVLLLDELALADDAVIERLNSVLEPDRTLTLPEKGGDPELVIAAREFRVVATMNPAGDFGKRELSPALRNRLVEIYIPPLSDADTRDVVAKMTPRHLPSALAVSAVVSDLVLRIKLAANAAVACSVREVRGLMSFIGACCPPDDGSGETRDALPASLPLPRLSVASALIHAVGVTLLDGVGVGTGMSRTAAEAARARCYALLGESVSSVLAAGPTPCGDAPAAPAVAASPPKGPKKGRGAEPSVGGWDAACREFLAELGGIVRAYDEAAALSSDFKLPFGSYTFGDDGGSTTPADGPEDTPEAPGVEAPVEAPVAVTAAESPQAAASGRRKRGRGGKASPAAPTATESPIAVTPPAPTGHADSATEPSATVASRGTGPAAGHVGGLPAVFTFTAPGVRRNVLRVLRALVPGRSVLLEGASGVGKTSLVAALGAAVGKEVVRINFSDQTDMMDLLGRHVPVTAGDAPADDVPQPDQTAASSEVPEAAGPSRKKRRKAGKASGASSDAPVEAAEAPAAPSATPRAGAFRWAEGTLLGALRRGAWVVLDELNLAPQAVLEGLNAMLDHRANLFVPEVGATYPVHPQFRVFACQNPVAHGGGRRGLPRSFLSRFVRVWLDPLTEVDLREIAVAAVSKAIGRGAVVAPVAAPPLAESDDEAAVANLVASATAAATSNHAARVLGGGVIDKMVAFLGALPASLIATYDLNARDVLRWCEAMLSLHTTERGPVAAVFAADGEAARGSRRRARAVAAAAAGASEDACSLAALAPALVGTLFAGRMRSVKDVSDVWAAAAAVWAPGSSPVAAAAALCPVSRLYRSLQAAPAEGGDTVLGPLRAALEPVGYEPGITEAAVHTAVALASGRLVILCGSAGSGCSRVVRAAAAMHGVDSSDIVTVALSSGFDAVDLLGCYAQVPGEAGAFAWADAPTITAIETGAWLVLEGAHHSAPNVLDRLNSLLEPPPGGTLILNEMGLDANGNVRTVVPHPAFRLIVTLDPSAGGVSRALRNRAVEVPVPAVPLPVLAMLHAAPHVLRASPAAAPQQPAAGGLAVAAATSKAASRAAAAAAAAAGDWRDAAATSASAAVARVLLSAARGGTAAPAALVGAVARGHVPAAAAAFATALLRRAADGTADSQPDGAAAAAAACAFPLLRVAPGALVAAGLATGSTGATPSAQRSTGRGGAVRVLSHAFSLWGSQVSRMNGHADTAEADADDVFGCVFADPPAALDDAAAAAVMATVMGLTGVPTVTTPTPAAAVTPADGMWAGILHTAQASPAAVARAMLRGCAPADGDDADDDTADGDAARGIEGALLDAVFTRMAITAAAAAAPDADVKMGGTDSTATTATIASRLGTRVWAHALADMAGAPVDGAVHTAAAPSGKSKSGRSAKAAAAQSVAPMFALQRSAPQAPLPILPVQSATARSQQLWGGVRWILLDGPLGFTVPLCDAAPFVSPDRSVWVAATHATVTAMRGAVVALFDGIAAALADPATAAAAMGAQATTDAAAATAGADADAVAASAIRTSGVLRAAHRAVVLAVAVGRLAHALRGVIAWSVADDVVAAESQASAATRAAAAGAAVRAVRDARARTDICGHDSAFLAALCVCGMICGGDDGSETTWGAVLRSAKDALAALVGGELALVGATAEVAPPRQPTGGGRGVCDEDMAPAAPAAKPAVVGMFTSALDVVRGCEKAAFEFLRVPPSNISSLAVAALAQSVAWSPVDARTESAATAVQRLFQRPIPAADRPPVAVAYDIFVDAYAPACAKSSTTAAAAPVAEASADAQTEALIGAAKGAVSANTAAVARNAQRALYADAGGAIFSHETAQQIGWFAAVAGDVIDAAAVAAAAAAEAAAASTSDEDDDDDYRMRTEDAATASADVAMRAVRTSSAAAAALTAHLHSVEQVAAPPLLPVAALLPALLGASVVTCLPTVTTTTTTSTGPAATGAQSTTTTTTASGPSALTRACGRLLREVLAVRALPWAAAVAVAAACDAIGTLFDADAAAASADPVLRRLAGWRVASKALTSSVGASYAAVTAGDAPAPAPPTDDVAMVAAPPAKKKKNKGAQAATAAAAPAGAGPNDTSTLARLAQAATALAYVGGLRYAAAAPVALVDGCVILTTATSTLEGAATAAAVAGAVASADAAVAAGVAIPPSDGNIAGALRAYVARSSAQPGTEAAADTPVAEASGDDGFAAAVRATAEAAVADTIAAAQRILAVFPGAAGPRAVASAAAEVVAARAKAAATPLPAFLAAGTAVQPAADEVAAYRRAAVGMVDPPTGMAEALCGSYVAGAAARLAPSAVMTVLGAPAGAAAAAHASLAASAVAFAAAPGARDRAPFATPYADVFAAAHQAAAVLFAVDRFDSLLAQCAQAAALILSIAPDGATPEYGVEPTPVKSHTAALATAHTLVNEIIARATSWEATASHYTTVLAKFDGVEDVTQPLLAGLLTARVGLRVTAAAIVAARERAAAHIHGGSAVVQVLLHIGGPAVFDPVGATVARLDTALTEVVSTLRTQGLEPATSIAGAAAASLSTVASRDALRRTLRALFGVSVRCMALHFTVGSSLPSAVRLSRRAAGVYGFLTTRAVEAERERLMATAAAAIGAERISSQSSAVEVLAAAAAERAALLAPSADAEVNPDAPPTDGAMPDGSSNTTDALRGAARAALPGADCGVSATALAAVAADGLGISRQNRTDHSNDVSGTAGEIIGAFLRETGHASAVMDLHAAALQAARPARVRIGKMGSTLDVGGDAQPTPGKALLRLKARGRYGRGKPKPKPKANVKGAAVTETPAGDLNVLSRAPAPSANDTFVHPPCTFSACAFAVNSVALANGADYGGGASRKGVPSGPAEDETGVWAAGTSGWGYSGEAISGLRAWVYDAAAASGSALVAAASATELPVCGDAALAGSGLLAHSVAISKQALYVLPAGLVAAARGAAVTETTAAQLRAVVADTRVKIYSRGSRPPPRPLSVGVAFQPFAHSTAAAVRVAAEPLNQLVARCDYILANEAGSELARVQMLRRAAVGALSLPLFATPLAKLANALTSVVVSGIEQLETSANTPLEGLIFPEISACCAALLTLRQQEVASWPDMVLGVLVAAAQDADRASGPLADALDDLVTAFAAVDAKRLAEQAAALAADAEAELPADGDAVMDAAPTTAVAPVGGPNVNVFVTYLASGSLADYEARIRLVRRTVDSAMAAAESTGTVSAATHAAVQAVRNVVANFAAHLPAVREKLTTAADTAAGTAADAAKLLMYESSRPSCRTNPHQGIATASRMHQFSLRTIRDFGNAVNGPVTFVFQAAEEELMAGTAPYIVTRVPPDCERYVVEDTDDGDRGSGSESDSGSDVSSAVAPKRAPSVSSEAVTVTELIAETLSLSVTLGTRWAALRDAKKASVQQRLFVKDFGRAARIVGVPPSPVALANRLGLPPAPLGPFPAALDALSPLHLATWRAAAASYNVLRSGTVHLRKAAAARTIEDGLARRVLMAAEALAMIAHAQRGVLQLHALALVKLGDGCTGVGSAAVTSKKAKAVGSRTAAADAAAAAAGVRASTALAALDEHYFVARSLHDGVRLTTPAHPALPALANVANAVRETVHAIRAVVDALASGIIVPPTATDAVAAAAKTLRAAVDVVAAGSGTADAGEAALCAASSPAVGALCSGAMSCADAAVAATDACAAAATERAAAKESVGTAVPVAPAPAKGGRGVANKVVTAEAAAVPSTPGVLSPWCPHAYVDVQVEGLMATLSAVMSSRITADGCVARTSRIAAVASAAAASIHGAANERLLALDAAIAGDDTGCAVPAIHNGMVEAAEAALVSAGVATVAGDNGAVVTLPESAEALRRSLHGHWVVCHLGASVVRVFTAILAKGFSPDEGEDGDGDGEGDGKGGMQMKDGTGMDDGKGEKDVTEQLTNEDQLLNQKDQEEDDGKQGKQKKKPNKDDQEEEEEDKAAEVTNDFAADLEDADRNDQPEHEDGDDMGDRMGDVDGEGEEFDQRADKDRDRKKEDRLRDMTDQGKQGDLEMNEKRDELGGEDDDNENKEGSDAESDDSDHEGGGAGKPLDRADLQDQGGLQELELDDDLLAVDDVGGDEGDDKDDDKDGADADDKTKEKQRKDKERDMQKDAREESKPAPDEGNKEGEEEGGEAKDGEGEADKGKEGEGERADGEDGDGERKGKGGKDDGDKEGKEGEDEGKEVGDDEKEGEGEEGGEAKEGKEKGADGAADGDGQEDDAEGEGGDDAKKADGEEKDTTKDADGGMENDEDGDGDRDGGDGGESEDEKDDAEGKGDDRDGEESDGDEEVDPLIEGPKEPKVPAAKEPKDNTEAKGDTPKDAAEDKKKTPKESGERDEAPEGVDDGPRAAVAKEAEEDKYEEQGLKAAPDMAQREACDEAAAPTAEQLDGAEDEIDPSGASWTTATRQDQGATRTQSMADQRNMDAPAGDRPEEERKAAPRAVGDVAADTRAEAPELRKGRRFEQEETAGDDGDSGSEKDGGGGGVGDDLMIVDKDDDAAEHGLGDRDEAAAPPATMQPDDVKAARLPPAQDAAQRLMDAANAAVEADAAAGEDDDKSKGDGKVRNRKAREREMAPTMDGGPPSGDDSDAENDLGGLEAPDAVPICENEDAARRLWSSLQDGVHANACVLCEQLRLVLEPTKRDRLGGDFKTGKRLSMKKVMAFVASGFRKDKVWLRRVKPRKRQYQILIAIDDSYSMATNGAGIAALSGALSVAQACTQLEVGDVGVLRFGTDVIVSHPFGQPHSDDSAVDLLRGFTFAQQGSSFIRLLDTCGPLLADTKILASAPSAAAAVTQIVFIVSDGRITESREKLAAAIQRLSDAHVMVCFIVIDTAALIGKGDKDPSAAPTAAVAGRPAAAAALTPLTLAPGAPGLTRPVPARGVVAGSQSVLEMLHVEFIKGVPHVRKYMDVFPFACHVVVGSAAALPDVLADVLRQWLELLTFA